MQHGHLAARLWGPDWDGREALHSQPPFHSDSLTSLYPSPTFSGARLLRRKVSKRRYRMPTHRPRCSHLQPTKVLNVSQSLPPIPIALFVLFMQT